MNKIENNIEVLKKAKELAARQRDKAVSAQALLEIQNETLSITKALMILEGQHLLFEQQETIIKMLVDIAGEIK